MPASTEIYYSRYENIRIGVEPVEEPDSVYFTDEAPEFELVITNETDRHVTSYEDEGVIWVLALGTGIPEAYKWESEEVEIEPHGEQRIRIGGELLAHEGNASIAINRNIGFRGNSSDDPIVLDPGPFDKENLRNSTRSPFGTVRTTRRSTNSPNAYRNGSYSCPSSSPS